tara:strand:+ start:1311 stop:1940 length:630 start_codon:yes stop_codon:yes gene_type:complete
MPYNDPNKLKEYRKKYNKEYRKKPENRAREKELNKNWLFMNREKKRKYQQDYQRKRRAKDVSFKLTSNIRRSLRQALTRKKSSKTQRTHKYLGCSLDWFSKEYWPSKISAWNQEYPEHKLHLNGNGIAIDHIKPVRAFQANELHTCFHYTNLQPLPMPINLRKRDTWSSLDDSHWRCHIIHNDKYTTPYLPVAMEKDGVMSTCKDGQLE